jgi:hypothetical protein
MRSHCLAIGPPILALLVYVGSGPSSAQHMGRPDMGPSSPEYVLIPVQLGPPSPGLPPSPSPLPNRTPPSPFPSNPTTNPPPSFPLPAPLSSSNPSRTGTSIEPQSTEGVSPRRTRSARHSSTNRRIKTTKTQRDPNIDGGIISDTNIPRLPNVFRNCEHPLPWYCEKPIGSLWFGSIATLRRHRRAE